MSACGQCLKEKQTFNLHIHVSRMFLCDVHNQHHFSHDFKLTLLELWSTASLSQILTNDTVRLHLFIF